MNLHLESTRDLETELERRQASGAYEPKQKECAGSIGVAYAEDDKWRIMEEQA